MKGLCVDIKSNNLEKIIRTISEVSDYCDAIKINLQSVLGLTLDEHKQITSHTNFSIIDAKLGDIGYSNKLALRFYERAGYDAITFNPYSGNIKETVNNTNMNVYVLTLMSNPEALRIQENVYDLVAKESVKSKAYGVVIGATIPEKYYLNVREIIGDMSVLHPGIGKQGGGIRKNCLNVVGRSITDSKNVRRSAKKFYERTRD